MSVLVVWFRNEKLYKAKACRSRSWRRTANQWNEYATLWNKRFGYRKNIVGVLSESVVLDFMRPHTGVPNHLPKDVLVRNQKMRELMRVAPWGNWKN